MNCAIGRRRWWRRSLRTVSEQDTVKRKELINHWNTISTPHNYTLGTIIGRKGLAIAKRFKNVPGGTPPYMYQWVEDVLMSEMLWTPVDPAEAGKCALTQFPCTTTRMSSLAF